jgi:hypothetical protein
MPTASNATVIVGYGSRHRSRFSVIAEPMLVIDDRAGARRPRLRLSHPLAAHEGHGCSAQPTFDYLPPPPYTESEITFRAYYVS